MSERHRHHFFTPTYSRADFFNVAAHKIREFAFVSGLDKARTSDEAADCILDLTENAWPHATYLLFMPNHIDKARTLWKVGSSTITHNEQRIDKRKGDQGSGNPHELARWAWWPSFHVWNEDEILADSRYPKYWEKGGREWRELSIYDNYYHLDLIVSAAVFESIFAYYFPRIYGRENDLILQDIADVFLEKEQTIYRPVLDVLDRQNNDGTIPSEKTKPLLPICKKILKEQQSRFGRGGLLGGLLSPSTKERRDADAVFQLTPPPGYAT